MVYDEIKWKTRKKSDFASQTKQVENYKQMWQM